MRIQIRGRPWTRGCQAVARRHQRRLLGATCSSSGAGESLENGDQLPDVARAAIAVADVGREELQLLHRNVAVSGPRREEQRTGVGELSFRGHGCDPGINALGPIVAGRGPVTSRAV